MCCIALESIALGVGTHCLETKLLKIWNCALASSTDRYSLSHCMDNSKLYRIILFHVYVLFMLPWMLGFCVVLIDFNSRI